jgi:exodeoxyribonuclease VII small subunit
VSEQPDAAKQAPGKPGTEQLGPEQQSYEQARAELEDVVRRLEAGGVPLEESLALWERGEELARRCQAWLDGARQRMARAREAGSGGPEANGDGPGN